MKAYSSAANALDARIKTGSHLLVRRINIQDKTGTYYNPDNYLLGRILSNVKKNAGQQCIIHVQCWRDRQLVLHPDLDRAYTNLTDSQLKNLGIATLGEKFSITINRVCNTGKEELPVSKTGDLRSMSINHLIWDLALRTARGRVPEGTDLSMSFHLRAWPNFPRLPHTPHGMRIASMWAGNLFTLDHIAGSLHIDLSDVYSFYSAAVATGLIGSSTHREDSLIVPNTMKNKPPTRGLLASILRRVGKIGNNT